MPWVQLGFNQEETVLDNMGMGYDSYVWDITGYYGILWDIMGYYGIYIYIHIYIYIYIHILYLINQLQCEHNGTWDMGYC